MEHTVAKQRRFGTINDNQIEFQPRLPMQPTPQNKRLLTQSDILGAVLIYGTFAALWILVSDSAVEWLFSDPAKIMVASTVKGWVFVAVTCLLLYGLLQRHFGRREREVATETNWRRLVLAFIAIAIAITAMTAIAIVHTIRQQEDKEVLRLQAIADMKSAQVANWLVERRNSAGFLQSSNFLGDAFQRWQTAGDERSHQMLLARLREFVAGSGFEGVALLDALGRKTLWDSRDPTGGQPARELQEAVAKTLQDGNVVAARPYRDSRGRTHLDLVVQLPAAGGLAGPVAVLHADPDETLYPTLQRWPGESTTGEILMVRRDGDDVVYLNELRHRVDTALNLHLPASTPELLAAKVIRGEVAPGTVVRGVDYRGVAALGVARAVSGTDWLVVAKIDKTEMYAGAMRDSVWVGLAGLLALFMVTAVGLQFHQYRQLQVSRRKLEGQVARLRSFDILNAIAEGSTDAIFAKDSEGRYLLFNREAERATGKAAEEVLGRDDLALFPSEQAAVVMANDRKVMADDRTVTLIEELDTQDGTVTYSSIKGTLHDGEGRVVGMFGVSRDITERRREERALADEAARRRILFDQASDGIVILSREGGVVDANTAFASMLGYEPVEAHALHVWDWDPDWTADKLQASFASRRASLGAVTFETRWRRKDGSVVPIEIAANEVDLRGMVVSYCVCRDISRRMEAEEALTASETNLMQSQRIAAIGHYVLDVVTGRWESSPVLDELFGIDASYPHDTDGWLNLVAAEDRESMGAYLRDHVLDRGQLFDREYRIVRPDNGQIRWLHGLGRLEVDSDGKPTHMVGTIQDVTERRRAEDQLRKLSLAVEQSPESIVITDLDARIEYVNDAFVRVTGYRREDVIGQNPRILHSGATPRETFGSLWAALRRGQSWKGEFHNKRKDGSDYVEFAIITPIRQPDGRITHFVAVKEDITEKKRLGAELDRHRHHLEEMVLSRTVELAEARVKAESASRAKGAFLANMSHEIRTPMNAILGLTHLLRRAQPAGEQGDRLDKIETAAQHLLSIVNDVLDLSKIEAGRLELERTDFPLAAVLDHVRSLIADQARRKGLSIEISSDDNAFRLRGDPTRLRQALLNYASNAVKFTDKGTIRMRAHRLASSGDEILMRFEVEDTGIGIARDKIPKLFDAFEQADPSTTRKYGGTGLGLAITKRLASLMGGEAGVESVSGNGSLFWFTARLAPGASVVVPPQAAIEPGGEARLRSGHFGARLLLAEDNAVNREVAQELLRGAGLSVDIAEDGHEALAKARETTYDLILMDVQMPDMDGIEATRAIRALPGGANLPILAMTADAFEETRRACIDAGMNDFVAKPVDPEALYATLMKWLPARTEAPAPHQPAVPEDESDLRRRLDEIEGLVVERGLSATLGRVTNYVRLLRLFADNHEPDSHRLLNADLPELQRVAHALKGVAGTLGATRVQVVAERLQIAVRTGASEPEIESGRIALATELTGLIASIRAVLRDARDSGAPPPTADIGVVIDRLAGLLATGDLEANTFAREYAESLATCFGEAGGELLRRISIFDHEGALNMLDAMRSPTHT